MKRGSVLTESLIALVLSFLFFILVIAAVERTLQNQAILETESSELADLLSISNVAASGGNEIPSYLMEKVATKHSTDGGICYEYRSESTGKTYRFKTGDGTD